MVTTKSIKSRMYTFSPMMVANSQKHHCRVRLYTREVLVISTNLDIQKNHYPLDFTNRKGVEARIKNTWYNQGLGYQEEREEHVNVENVVELESNTEEKPKKTRATHTKIRRTSTLQGHLKIYPKFPKNMLDGQTQLSIQKGDDDDRKMIA
ncbi:hypothetical protein Tco_1195723 [Tanacetum coccineum]